MAALRAMHLLAANSVGLDQLAAARLAGGDPVRCEPVMAALREAGVP